MNNDIDPLAGQADLLALPFRRHFRGGGNPEESIRSAR